MKNYQHLAEAVSRTKVKRKKIRKAAFNTSTYKSDINAASNQDRSNIQL